MSKPDKKASKKPRAIDLYSGIGGWSLGLQMAGIEVVGSYEKWDEAISTYNNNFTRTATKADIRELDLSTLPKDIDVVVGSPPCTQFSSSNRGGNGNIEEGLQDIIATMRIIEYVKPKYWVIENVPRVIKVINEEVSKGKALYQYRNMIKEAAVLDFSEFGLPQRRKRALIGSFPLEQLVAYKALLEAKTLGEILSSLEGETIQDPIYDRITLRRNEVTDINNETPLNTEEMRINKSAKMYHPVYNGMAFPDNPNKPARTITATCTRVSRESIIVGARRKFRRLSVREKATLQSFPITFRFYGNTYASRNRMVGNAIPPLISYLIGCSILSKQVNIKIDSKRIPSMCNETPINVKTDTSGSKYKPNRVFKYVIPGLRLGSGVRFELDNITDGKNTSWRVKYFYGNSKNIKEIKLDKRLINRLKSVIDENITNILSSYKDTIFPNIDGNKLQLAWIHKEKGYSPFKLIDNIGNLVSEVNNYVEKYEKGLLSNIINNIHGFSYNNKTINNKYDRNSSLIISGFIACSWFNINYR